MSRITLLQPILGQIQQAFGATSNMFKAVKLLASALG
jgi:hypothetical protein